MEKFFDLNIDIYPKKFRKKIQKIFEKFQVNGDFQPMLAPNSCSKFLKFFLKISKIFLGEFLWSDVKIEHFPTNIFNLSNLWYICISLYLEMPEENEDATSKPFNPLLTHVLMTVSHNPLGSIPPLKMDSHPPTHTWWSHVTFSIAHLQCKMLAIIVRECVCFCTRHATKKKKPSCYCSVVGNPETIDTFSVCLTDPIHSSLLHHDHYCAILSSEAKESIDLGHKRERKRWEANLLCVWQWSLPRSTLATTPYYGCGIKIHKQSHYPLCVCDLSRNERG